MRVVPLVAYYTGRRIIGADLYFVNMPQMWAKNESPNQKCLRDVGTLFTNSVPGVDCDFPETRKTTPELRFCKPRRNHKTVSEPFHQNPF